MWRVGRPLEMVDVQRRGLVDARHHHRQHLAHVADDELELGMLVERAGEHHAEQMDRGLRMPAPAGGLEHALRAFGRSGVVGLPHGSGRQVRMDVDRHVEFDGRGEQSVIARMIEETALGGAVDQRAEKRSSFTRARSSAAQASGLCIGSAAKPAKRSGCRATAAARWSFISRAMATPSGPGTRSGPGPLCDSTCMVMPASSIDLSRFSPISGSKLHRVRPAGRRLARLEAAPGHDGWIDALDQGRDGEMLFERNDTHGRFSPHCSVWLSHSLSPAGKPRLGGRVMLKR